MPPAKLGLVYSHTGIRKFIDAVGAPRTRELFLRRPPHRGQAALNWGLVNSVVEREELEAAALELAIELAGNAPLAQLGNKRVIRAVLDAEGRSSRRRASADRAAAGLLQLRGLPRRRPRVRGEARPAWRALSQPASAAAAWRALAAAGTRRALPLGLVGPLGRLVVGQGLRRIDVAERGMPGHEPVGRGHAELLGQHRAE